MRLLKCGDGGGSGISFETFDGENVPPPYAILSHTWANEEVLFQEIQSGKFRHKHGYRKIQFCIKQARRDGLNYCWVDTCCINRTDAVELQEAINRMFRWYQRAKKCYAYLEDVPSSDWAESFGKSRWFKRGWTLQELIAPEEVEFFSQDYVRIGCKKSLERNVLEASKIPAGVLRGQDLSDFTREERVTWMRDRQTTRAEDTVYSLFGILDVFISLMYGEGKDNAQRRLWEAVASPWQPLQAYAGHWPAPSPVTGFVHRCTDHPPPAKRPKISPNPQPSEPDTSDTHGRTRLARYTPMGSPDELTPEAALNDTQRQALLDSLIFEQMDSRQMSVKVAHAKTCKWLLKKSEYLDWLDAAKLPDHHGFLWMKGKPGTGKSTLMKFALTSSRKSLKGHTVVSFFFNARGSGLEKSTIGMYRSLLLQLLKRLPQLQSVFESLGLASWNCTSDYTWTIEALKGLFQQVVQSLGQNAVACFIDALDECGEDQIRDMVAFFQGLGADAVTAGIRFQIFFSSRHYPHITISWGLSLVLEGQEGHDEDITRYIDMELKIGQTALAKKIKVDLQEKSTGVFMWAVLVVDMLNKEHDEGRSARRLQEKLSEIPGDLHKLFQDILTRDCRNREELLLCIQWLLFARQPLKPEQLYFAVLSGTEPVDVSAWNPDEIPMDTIKRFILNSSKGLAEVTKSKIPTVQFIHESVRDFLLKENGLSAIWSDLGRNFAGQSHDRLKQCSLRYMDIDVAAHLNIEDPLPKASSTEGASLRQRASKQFPFLQYAVENVLWHAEAAQTTEVNQRDFLSTFPLAEWLELHNIVEKYDSRRYTKASLLYILAEFDLPALAEVHGNIKHVFDTEDERYGTPIFAALASGSHRAAAGMLESLTRTYKELSPIYTQWKLDGRDHSAFGRDFKYPRRRGVLHYLAEKGDETLLAFALVLGIADVDLKDRLGRTPLSLAAGKGHKAIVKLLLATGKVDADSQDRDGQTPLSLAAMNGHEAVVKALLATGQVDPDSKASGYSEGRTPLSYAARNGHEDVVKILLATGQVEPGSMDHNGRTPLSWAAMDGRKAIVEVLLATDQVDPDSKDKNEYCKGRTPLSWAAENGHEAIVKLLLATGKVDADSKDRHGRTPLRFAAMNRHEAIVKLLLATGKVDRA